MPDLMVNIYQYFNCQASVYKNRQVPQFVPGFVTISRQAGAGGVSIGERLAKSLNEALPNPCMWTVFDKNLVFEVIKEHNFPEKMQPYLKEECHPEVEDMLEDIFGLHPAQDTLVGKTNNTILHLARMGRSIIVGRGSCVITRKLPLGVHVRLVGSLNKRVESVKEEFQLTTREAQLFIEREDRGRTQYLKKYFECDINDPLLYDVIINTDTVSYDNAALLIKDMVIRKIA